MAEKKMIVDGVEITVIKKKMKNMYLRVLPPDGRVVITAPARTSDDVIRRFAQSRRDWIYRQKKRMETRAEKRPVRYETGETVRLRGEEYLLEYRDPEEAETGRERRYGKTEAPKKIVLYADENASQEGKAGVLREFYRQQMKADVSDVFPQCERTVGVRAEEWRIREMKTRWGTCNTVKGRVWLNLRLIEMPPECLIYVIIHELTHLLEPSHNQRFYRLMDQFLPGWQAIRRRMKEW